MPPLLRLAAFAAWCALASCGSITPNASSHVSSSPTPLPSIALRFYFTSPDCLGARNDSYFPSGNLSACEYNAGLGALGTVVCAPGGSWAYTPGCAGASASRHGESRVCLPTSSNTSLLVFCSGVCPSPSFLTLVLALAAVVAALWAP